MLWKYLMWSPSYSSPAIANGIVYIGSGNARIYALNLTTGALMWKYVTDNVLASSPAVVNGMVYIGSEGGVFYAFGLPVNAMAKMRDAR